jgi:hypothetical protein
MNDLRSVGPIDVSSFPCIIQYTYFQLIVTVSLDSVYMSWDQRCINHCCGVLNGLADQIQNNRNDAVSGWNESNHKTRCTPSTAPQRSALPIQLNAGRNMHPATGACRFRPRCSVLPLSHEVEASCPSVPPSHNFSCSSIHRIRRK